MHHICIASPGLPSISHLKHQTRRLQWLGLTPEEWTDADFSTPLEVDDRLDRVRSRPPRANNLGARYVSKRPRQQVGS